MPPIHRSRIFRVLAILAPVALGGVALLFLTLWSEHRTQLTLPTPTGYFAVGRTTFAWINHAQTDEIAPSPGTKRPLLVWIWYPAAPAPSAPHAEYLPAPWRAALAQHTGALMTQFLTRDPAVVQAHSFSDPPLSPEQPSYPVVILRTGLGALTVDYTTLAEDLASHGYVVVGFDAPYRTAVVVLPDGRVIFRPASANPENFDGPARDRLVEQLLAMWTSDVRFVVNQLEQLNADPSSRFAARLDLKRLGIFGHSLGGATALQFCHDDPRCKAAINLDGNPFGSVVHEGLSEPAMILLSDHGDLSTADGGEVFPKIQSVYNHLSNGRLLLVMRGANHFSFSDQILLKSHYVVRLLSRLDARRGLAITADYVHTFFDVHLKNTSSALLDALRARDPEVQPVAVDASHR